MTNHRRITPAKIAEARAKAAGTYVYPAPVKASGRSRFAQSTKKVQADRTTALRAKDGQRQ